MYCRAKKPLAFKFQWDQLENKTQLIDFCSEMDMIQKMQDSDSHEALKE